MTRADFGLERSGSGRNSIPVKAHGGDIKLGTGFCRRDWRRCNYVERASLRTARANGEGFAAVEYCLAARDTRMNRTIGGQMINSGRTALAGCTFRNSHSEAALRRSVTSPASREKKCISIG